MNDDVQWLHIIFVCLLILAVPVTAQAVLALFAFAFVLTARFAPEVEDSARSVSRDRHDAPGGP